MLSQHTDEVKLIETQQHNQFIFRFSIIGRLLQTSHSLQTCLMQLRIHQKGMNKNTETEMPTFEIQKS